jgi:hypothetical protein
MIEMNSNDLAAGCAAFLLIPLFWQNLVRFPCFPRRILLSYYFTYLIDLRVIFWTLTYLWARCFKSRAIKMCNGDTCMYVVK